MEPASRTMDCRWDRTIVSKSAGRSTAESRRRAQPRRAPSTTRLSSGCLALRISVQAFSVPLYTGISDMHTSIVVSKVHACRQCVRRRPLHIVDLSGFSQLQCVHVYYMPHFSHRQTTASQPSQIRRKGIKKATHERFRCQFRLNHIKSNRCQYFLDI